MIYAVSVGIATSFVLCQGTFWGDAEGNGCSLAEGNREEAVAGTQEEAQSEAQKQRQKINLPTLPSHAIVLLGLDGLHGKTDPINVHLMRV